MANNITGLIGYPVSHSLSPLIHDYWLKVHGIDCEYKLFTTAPNRLRQTMLHMRKKNVRGVNITVPHKQAVIEYLDGLDPIAERLGAVNTVINRDGVFIGSNTDGYGFIASLKAELGALNPYLGTVVLLGAGGATRAIIAALKNEGARDIIVTNRTFDAAKDLALRNACQAVAWSARDTLVSDATLLVNTTSLGMQHMPPLEISLEKLAPHAAVCDIVYAPHRTTLLKEAAARGNKTVGGLGMLAYQAQGAFHAWHGILPEVTPELLSLLEGSA